MRKTLVLAALICIPQTAYAGFAINTSSPSAAPSESMTTMTAPADIAPAAGAEEVLPQRLLAKTAPAAPSSMNVSTISRARARPSLEIVNERFVPAEIEQKYAPEKAPAPQSLVNDIMPAQETLPVPQENPATQTSIRTITVTAAKEPEAIAEIKEISTVPVPTEAKGASAKSLVIEDKVKKPIVPVPPERYATWRARKGELLRDVLQRWAVRSDTDFIWSAVESPKIAADFSYIGNFEGATAKLMENNPSQLNMKFGDGVNETAIEPMAGNAVVPVTLEANAIPATPVEINAYETASVISDFSPMTRPSANPMIVPEMPIDDMSSLAPASLDNGSDLKSFYAAKGSSLKDVMEAWAETENAQVIWQTADQFTIMSSINEKQGYESAVEKILASFNDQKERPVGQLYKNPVTGEKVLVIRTDKA